MSPHGLWLLASGRELFLPFKDFPWFEHASIHDLSNVELHGTDHLYWPALDVDLSLDSIEHPELYPLLMRSRPAKVRERTRPRGSKKR